MSEIPYDPDFAHMISSALISGDYDMARFLLASGAFGDSLNHAYKTDLEGVARQFLYGLRQVERAQHQGATSSRGTRRTRTARSPRGWSANGIFSGFVEEAWKNYEAAREALNDLLLSSEKEPIPEEVVAEPLRLQAQSRTSKTACRSRGSTCTRRTSTTFTT